MPNNKDLDFSTDFTGLDFYNIDAQFTEEERMYRVNEGS